MPKYELIINRVRYEAAKIIVELPDLAHADELMGTEADPSLVEGITFTETGISEAKILRVAEKP